MKTQKAFSTHDKTNTILLNVINNSTGIRYRELQRATGIAHGRLEYHLKILERLKRIKVRRYNERKSTRYYPLNTTTKESHIIEFVKHETAKEIVQLLLEQDICTYDDIIRRTKKVASTIAWHLSRLKEGGIISVGKHGKYRVYRLRNKELIMTLMNGGKN